MMKRCLALLVVVALCLCGLTAGLADAELGRLRADEIGQYVESLGFVPNVSKNEEGISYCAFHEAFSGAFASLSWADDQSVYTVSESAWPDGQEKTLRELYLELVNLSDWPATWIDDGQPKNAHVLLGFNAPFGTEPESAFDSLADYAEAVRERLSEAKAITYVLNMNTHKMHYPNCSSVAQIKDTNRKDFSGTREEAIAMGYVPCKKCNP